MILASFSELVGSSWIERCGKSWSRGTRKHVLSMGFSRVPWKETLVVRTRAPPIFYSFDNLNDSGYHWQNHEFKPHATTYTSGLMAFKLYRTAFKDQKVELFSRTPGTEKGRVVPTCSRMRIRMALSQMSSESFRIEYPNLKENILSWKRIGDQKKKTFVTTWWLHPINY